jgi:threonine/homoserine/homoserine lactone efflux protein
VTVTSAVLSFAVVAGLLTVVPGLDTALVVRTTLAAGARAGFAAALGIGAGVLVWGVAAAVGVAAVLSVSTWAGTALRVAGALYVGWLGIVLLRTAFRRGDGAPGLAVEAGEATGHARARLAPAFRRGFLMNLLNPKIGAFYVAVIPHFLPDGVSPALMGLLLALVHDVEGIVWFALVISGVTRMRRVLARPRVVRAVDGVTGTALVGFGVALVRQAR